MNTKTSKKNRVSNEDLMSKLMMADPVKDHSLPKKEPKEISEDNFGSELDDEYDEGFDTDYGLDIGFDEDSWQEDPKPKIASPSTFS